MGVNEVMQIITTVGFPIFMCLVLAYYVKAQTEAHKQETKEFTEALNKNTLVLQKLCDKMDLERDE